MADRRKLIKVAEFKQIMAEGHEIEGTRLYVLELLMWGSAYSSYYVLLKSKAFLEKLDDEAVRSAVMGSPSRYGKKLEFGKQLEFDTAENCAYYIGEVKEKDLVKDDKQS